MSVYKRYFATVLSHSLQFTHACPDFLSYPRWADDEDDEGADEVSGSNYVSKAEFDDDDEEMDEDDGFDESEDDEPETGVEDLSSFTVPQLKAKLKEAGLPVSGVKAELIERLSTVQ